MPDSSTQIVPVISPLPLRTKPPANTALLATRQHRGDPGAHGTAVLEILDQGRVPDGDPGNVGYRVQRAGRSLEGNADVAGACRPIVNARHDCPRTQERAK